MPGIIRCLNCKSEVPAGAKFCPQCAEKIPSEQVGGFKIGAVGLRQAGTIHSDNQEKTSGPAGDYCQICGLWVKTEDSFRCKMCGQAAPGGDLFRMCCEIAARSATGKFYK
jgi:hypothetical protein